MATERIDIIINSRGERTVVRKLDQIGGAARRTFLQVRNLNAALVLLGGFGLARGLQRSFDTLTNFENRIRLVTESEKELIAVEKELFGVAARSRTGYEATAEIYARLALNSRQLGVSQKELVEITETLNKATILSGASAREANAALVQLAQGLASNRLSGDELRSVLEQLPLVADIIAKKLGITRGELRKFGRDGKITADVVIEAFKDAREEIAEKFAQTIPTLEQSFSVLNTRFLELLDNFDDATGFSGALSQAIITIADSLETLAAAVTAVGVGFAVVYAGKGLRALLGFIAANKALRVAIAAGNATLLTSTGIAEAKALSSLNAARAQAAETAATVRQTTADVAQLQVQRALLLQQQAMITIDSRRRIARDALTGRFIAYNAAVAQNVRTNIALSQTERALTASRAALASATTAATAAQNALTGATARASVATSANNTIVAGLQSRFPLLANAIGAAGGAFSKFGAVLAKNPFGAILTAIIAVSAALAVFGDGIKVTEDGVVSMKDVVIAAFQLIGEAVAPVAQFILDAFRIAWLGIKIIWNGAVAFFGLIASNIIDFMTLPPRIILAAFEGGYAAVTAAWGQAPVFFGEVGAKIANAMIAAFEFMIKVLLQALQRIANPLSDIFAFAGIPNPLDSLINSIDGSLPRFEGAGEAVGGSIAGSFVEGFNKSLESTAIGDDVVNFIGSVGAGVSDAVLERARAIAEERAVDLGEVGDAPDLKKGAGAGGGGGGGGKGGKTFADIVANLQQENELLKVNAREREVLSKILEIEKELKRELSEQEKVIIRALLEENRILKKQQEILERLQGPIDEYNDGLAAANGLLKEGKINQEQFNLVLSQMELPTALRELDQELLGTRFAYEGVVAEIRAKEAEQLEVVRQALEARIIMEQEAADRIAAIRVNTERKILQANLTSLKNQLDATASAFDTLTNFAKEYAGEQSGIYKGIFVAKQAFAVASAIVNTAQAVTEALASGPPPFNYIQAAAVGAAGAAQVATIIGQTISAFADGGEVRGPGGRRQDRVRAMLSPGEFVINADAAQKNLSLLRAINDGEVPSGASIQQLARLLPGRSSEDVERAGNRGKSPGFNRGERPTGGTALTVIQNITATDAESFGQSQRQNARSSKRAFSRIE